MARERAVVVGAGGISGAWFRPLKVEGVEIVAVVDKRLEAAKEKVEKWGLSAPASDDLGKTLAETEAEFVVDITVPEAHCEVTCAALRAGLHVIGEKPMASSMDEARRMVAASEKAGRLYMVSQSRRWNTHHAAMAKTVAEGRLGALTTVNCDFFLGAHFGGFRDEMESPLILDMAIHQFDMARMFSGKDPLAVYAREFNPAGSWYRGDVAANCIFEMTDAVEFCYRGSWCAEGCTTGWEGNWRLIGDRGTMLYTKGEEPWGEVVAGEEGFQRKLAPLEIAGASVEFGGQRGALREMLAFLRDGTRPQCECHDNIKSLAMVFAAIESSRSLARVEIGDV
jgi:predicted dehydrogenase